MPELLGKYDELNQTTDMPLNMENYKGVGLENKNLIVSTEQERILKTLESKDDLNKEFKQVQNQIVANNQDARTNADVIFNHMADNQKEQLSLIPLSEAISKDNLDIELLEKLRFFVTNKYINPYSYKIDLEIKTHAIPLASDYGLSENKNKKCRKTPLQTCVCVI